MEVALTAGRVALIIILSILGGFAIGFLLGIQEGKSIMFNKLKERIKK